MPQNTQPTKRIRPLISVGEAFRMPQVIFYPALLVSLALIPMSLLVKPFSIGTLIGSVIASALFAGLILFVVIIPAINASRLKSHGIDGTAVILNKEKRSRTLITEQYNTLVAASYVTFEFTPQGASEPILLEAEVERIYSKLQEGKTAKIRYASSNPRIVKFIGE